MVNYVGVVERGYVLQDSLERLHYLITVHCFPDEEKELNKTTLTWPQKLGPIFDEHEIVSGTTSTCMCIPEQYKGGRGSCMCGKNVCTLTHLPAVFCTVASQMIEKTKHRGEKELTERQEKVLIEIEKAHRRVEELSEYNDLNSAAHYVKDITQLQRRLGELQDQIAQINKVIEIWLP